MSAQVVDMITKVGISIIIGFLSAAAGVYTAQKIMENDIRHMGVSFIEMKTNMGTSLDEIKTNMGTSLDEVKTEIAKLKAHDTRIAVLEVKQGIIFSQLDKVNNYSNRPREPTSQ